MDIKGSIDEIRKQLNTVRCGLLDKSMGYQEAREITRSAIADARALHEVRRRAEEVRHRAEMILQHQPEAKLDLVKLFDMSHALKDD